MSVEMKIHLRWETPARQSIHLDGKHAGDALLLAENSEMDPLHWYLDPIPGKRYNALEMDCITHILKSLNNGFEPCGANCPGWPTVHGSPLQKEEV